MFSKNKYEYQTHKNFGRSPDEIDTFNDNTVIDLERELNMDREKIIISGEDISALKSDEIQSLLNWLKARVASIKVVAYVRDPVGFASSELQQCIYGRMQKPVYPRRITEITSRLIRNVMMWIALNLLSSRKLNCLMDQ